jgi:hypothetical protein
VTPDKRAAHSQAAPILQAIVDDPATLTWALRSRVNSSRDSLCAGHYPVLDLPIDSNPWFGLVMNCWLALPDCATNVTTKAIHHHGTMLLTTVTAFGPGYEHWTFTTPERVDDESELFTMRVINTEAHTLQHTAFVDSYIAHVPMFVPSLSITLALWSNSQPTTWLDHVKRIPVLERNTAKLRGVATRAGLAKQLALKNVSYFDFYPSDGAFTGMKNRREFPLGPNDDFLYSLFHIVQQTNNHSLANFLVESGSRQRLPNRDTFNTLIARLQRDDIIDARLSTSHYGVENANFTVEDIRRALVPGPAKTR